MAFITLVVAVVLGAASALFMLAGAYRQSSGWTSDLCLAVLQLCNSPELLAVAGVGFAGVYIILKIVTTLRA
jgi:hypothetical protein